MKTVFRILVPASLSILMSSAAFAGGGGDLSCNYGQQIVALYSFFHSVADSYSIANVFVQDPATGKFKHYEASNEAARTAVEIKLKDGRKLKVSADEDLNGCTISVEEKRR